MNKNNTGTIVGIAILCAILAFTSPSKSQFTDYVSSKLFSKMNNEELNANPLAKQFAKGLTNLFLDNAVEEKDYVLFKIFTIDLHLIRAFNSSVNDVKFIGIAGQFIPLDSNLISDIDNKKSTDNKQAITQSNTPNTPENTGSATSQLNTTVQTTAPSGSAIQQGVATSSQLYAVQPQESAKQSAAPFQSVFANADLNSMMQAIYYSNSEQLSNAFGKLKLSDKPSPVDKTESRKLNTQGLTEFKSENYSAAENYFIQANNLNAGDAEVINNLAYAQLKEGKYQQSKQNLEKALMLAPDRSSAWFNLSEDLIYDNSAPASACSAMALGLKFSRNRDKSINFMNQRITEEGNSVVKDKLLNALDCANSKTR